MPMGSDRRNRHRQRTSLCTSSRISITEVPDQSYQDFTLQFLRERSSRTATFRCQRSTSQGNRGRRIEVDNGRTISLLGGMSFYSKINWLFTILLSTRSRTTIPLRPSRGDVFGTSTHETSALRRARRISGYPTPKTAKRPGRGPTTSSKGKMAVRLALRRG
jgi:hypothetical protein